MKNIETWSLEDLRALNPNVSSEHLDTYLNSHSIDDSMNIADYIKQLDKEDELGRGKISNDMDLKIMLLLLIFQQSFPLR